MDAFLSHATALAALRSPRLYRALARGDRVSAQAPEALSDAGSLAELRRRFPALAEEGPLEFAVREGRPGELRRRGVRVRIEHEPLPEGAAVRVAEGVLCSSPELVCVQMAPWLTDLELAVLLCELTGLYVVSPDSEDGMTQRDVPATTPERVRAFLDALGPRRGVRRVRTALSRSCACSGSPRESKLCLRLTLRPGLGGWHLPLLAMNSPIEVRRITDAMSTGVRKPDILLGSVSAEGQRRVVAVEYNGWRHELPARAASDATRTNELKAMGIGEYVVRREQYGDLDYMDGLVGRIRADLALPRTGLTREEAERRRALREQLHDELELIDGVLWNGRLRERVRASGVASEGCDAVPVEAYGLD